MHHARSAAELPGSGDSARAHRRLARASRYSSLLAVLASPAFAQEIAPPINWAFAAYFGTGHYRFDDGASAYVLTARPELAGRAGGAS